MNVALVVGARPQFVKAAPLAAALRSGGHGVTLIHTGQHTAAAMSDRFFEDLALPEPGVTIDVAEAADQDERLMLMTEGVAVALAGMSFDVAIVVGDADSTLAGARAAIASGGPVAHIEAGERAFEPEMREERNRIEVDRLADPLLCVHERAADQLRREDARGRIVVVGDLMRDALDEVLTRLPESATPGTHTLLTVHRAENADDPSRLESILQAAADLSTPECPVIFPAHPRTRAALEAGGILVPEGIRMGEPVGYPDLVALTRSARVVLTDSGGLQKEAYWLSVPCVTLRERTEWTETVETGWNTLVGTDPAAIVAAARAAARPADHPPLYGDGNAAEAIVEALAAGGGQ